MVVSPEYSRQTGFSLNAAWARQLGDSSALGVLFGGGADQFEGVLNLGFDLDARQSLVLSAGQLRQNLEFGFVSGAEHARLTQHGGGISYRYQLGQSVGQSVGPSVLQYLELDGYLARTGSRDLADRTYAIETLSLFELWNDPRRIAGGKVTGLRGRLGMAPLPGARVTLSLGTERLDYDLLTGKDRSERLTGGIEWQQQLSDELSLKAVADRQAAQDRYGLGLERRLSGGQRLGAELTHIQGRDGAPDDKWFQLNWSMAFGGVASSPRSGVQPASSSAGNSLLDRVANRPAYLPSQVVSKVDTSAIPTRLVVVDKTGLPVGSSIVSATGDITVPLGVTVTGIAGITLDGGAFANGGQFTAAGSTLRISPSLMTEPAVADTDTYVVTLNNLGGGTTLVTMVVSRGSVRVESIVTEIQSPPVMGDVPDQTATSGTAFNLNLANYVTLTNEDGVSSFALTGSLPTGMSFDSNTALLSGTPTQTGTFNLSVTASDDDGASNSDAFSLTVNAANQAPLANDASADAAGNNFVTVDFASLVSDDVTGNAQLVFELVTDGSPTGLLVSGSFPVLTFTNNYNGTNWGGNTFITYRVRDAGGVFSSVQRLDILNVDGNY